MSNLGRVHVVLWSVSVLLQVQSSRHDPCFRPCGQEGESRTCYYRFVLEHYHTMGAACGSCWVNRTACRARQCVTADGVERGILTVNRQLPGPSIQVCHGDRIVVDVKNLMPGRSTAIHWHGLLQDGSPFMDGVPMVTQCPITEGNTFRYEFIAMNPGTHFWHSHDGFQKLDGIVGSIVVRQPRRSDPVRDLYDRDVRSHVLLITDWLHGGADQRFPGLRKRQSGQNPDNFLINGLGLFTAKLPTLPFASLEPLSFRTSRPSYRMENGTASMGGLRKRGLGLGENATSQPRILEGAPPTPLAELLVRQGLRYRLRVIGATCLVCPVRLSVEKHRLLLVAADGDSVQPEYVHAAVLFPGERYDFVLEAGEELGAYWIHVQGTGPCALEGTHQVAVLRYIGSPHRTPSSPYPGYLGFFPHGRELNPDHGRCGPGHNGLCVTQLVSAAPPDASVLKAEPDVSVAMAFGFHFFSKRELFHSPDFHRFFQPPLPLLASGVINNISMVAAPVPLLSQLADFPAAALCPVSEGGGPECRDGFCECTHVVSVPLGAVVEFIIADESPIPWGLTHPFHLHGFEFWVLEIGVLPPGGNLAALIEGRRRQRLPPALAPVSKDTIAIPAAGYAVVRIKADNPGFWLFHCHFLYHHVSGMGLVLQVGTPVDLPAVPPGFPKCGDFLPSYM